MLIDVLREDIGLTGTKLVCGAGVCGACTVLLDGEPIVSCLLPSRAAWGKSVVIVEGIGGNDLHPCNARWWHAMRCNAGSAPADLWSKPWRFMMPGGGRSGGAHASTAGGGALWPFVPQRRVSGHLSRGQRRLRRPLRRHAGARAAG
jgi:hypothetical protein